MCQCARVCQSVPLCQRVATRPSSLVARPPPTSARHPPWVGRVCHFWRGIRIEMGTWHILCAYTTQGWQSDNHACAFRWLSIKFHQPQCASTHTRTHTPACAHSFTQTRWHPPTSQSRSRVGRIPSPSLQRRKHATPCPLPPRHTSRRWRRFPRHQDQPILSTAPFQRASVGTASQFGTRIRRCPATATARARAAGARAQTIQHATHAGENSAGGRTNVAPTACRGHHGCACSMRGTFILIGMRLKESRGLAS